MKLTNRDGLIEHDSNLTFLFGISLETPLHCHAISEFQLQIKKYVNRLSTLINTRWATTGISIHKIIVNLGGMISNNICSVKQTKKHATRKYDAYHPVL